MKNKITKELLEEQNKIIISKSKKMLVLAGPGSGKTHTIAKKAIQELNELKSEKKNKGVILCSYTRESSLELEQRLGTNIDSNSFVGTFDSFIFSEILFPFANRILKSNKKDLLLNKNFEFTKTSFGRNEEVNVLTREGLTDKNKDKIKKYYNEWVSNFQKNIYELSFSSYLFSGSAIEKMELLNKYINSKFNSIYIDEAQDLNYFQIWFLKKIIKSTKLNCYLIGDDKQSIYSFRGAKPLLFLSMVNDGFEKHEITHSVRCHYNILEFAKRIESNNAGNNILKNNNIININAHTNYIMVIKNLRNFFILTETNKEAELIYEECIKNGINDAIFSRGIELNSVDKNFSDNYYEIIEELLKFYFNYRNPIAKYAYPLENLISFLEPIVEPKKLNHNNLAWENELDGFLKKIFNLLKVNINKNILKTINEQMSKEIHINHYFKTDNKKRIMTIHSSKGLESENIFIILTRKSFLVDDETKRKLFVAITRAKEKIFINFKGDIKSHLEEYIINIFNKNFTS